MATLTRCPACRRQLRVPENLLGRQVKCPECGEIFVAVHTEDLTPGMAIPPRAESQEPPPPEPGRPPALMGLTSDYRINAGQWLHYASIHWSTAVGPMIGYLLLVYAIFGGLGICVGIISEAPGRNPGAVALANLVFYLVMILIGPPLLAGLTIVSLAQLKGDPWTFADFFAGFRRYGTLVGNYVLTLVIALGSLIPSILVLIIALATNDQAIFVASLFCFLINYLAMIYVMMRATFFCVPLIIDRNLGTLEAIQGSWIITRGHFWGLFGTALLLGLIAAAGLLLCLVGALLTVPLTILAQHAGYLLIAGTRRPVESPSPASRIEVFPEDEPREPR